eukprot:26261-Rhodomonas_salina.1
MSRAALSCRRNTHKIADHQTPGAPSLTKQCQRACGCERSKVHGRAPGSGFRISDARFGVEDHGARLFF